MSSSDDNSVMDFFSQLPQQGPGTDADTIAVLDIVRNNLPKNPTVIDFGCGTGRTTLALAEQLPDSHVVGIDALEVFVDVLERSIASRKLSHRIEAHIGDMANPPSSLPRADLIWCEGAVYHIGFAEALRIWRPLLSPRSYCVISECEWLSDAPPKPVADYWRENYPAMTDRQSNLRQAADAGYEVIGTQTLSDKGWDDYYGLISAAIGRGDALHLGTEFSERLLEEREIRDQANGSYGYVFYVMRKR